DVSIMTAEDPVEFNVDGITQVLVRTDIGLTFAAALRSFLRQDPDIIMVGEIRDGETADIAIKAALTGHLVFSTLHTNDAPSTINRLMDMGVPSYLVAASTKLIMAQRMVRKICVFCKQEVPVTAQIIDALRLTPEEAKTFKLFEGKGCNQCNNTGFSGRTGLFEVMPITPAIEKMIVLNASTSEIRAQAVSEGMLSLRHAGLEKLCLGISSLGEIVAETAL
ncbi:MAG TPA: type II secretion system protein GspE, partial [candidate division Zixibacteria bacterium]|nr:type II secretion system protein GspE [candidate division Zixibacteria bacterium]